MAEKQRETEYRCLMCGQETATRRGMRRHRGVHFASMPEMPPDPDEDPKVERVEETEQSTLPAA